jgi:MFS transporter, putative metabolite:H+ symporter
MMSIAARAIEEMPLGPAHRRIFWMLGWGMLVDAFDIFMQAGVLAAMVQVKFTDTSGVAHFISSTFLGLAVGSVASGVLADRWGRRSLYQFNLLLFGSCALLTSIVPSFGMVLVLRFLMSVGLGGELVTGYAMMSEMTPALQRGRWGVTLSLFVNMAQPLSALTGFVLLPVIGWRCMFVSGGVPAFIIWYLRRGLPESPRWLERRGRTAEAMATLGKLWAENTRGGVMPQLTESQPTEPTELSRTSLFSADRIGRTAFCALLLTLSLSSQYGFLTWVPTLLVKSGASFVHSLGYAATMAIGAPIGMIMGLSIIDRIGRKPLLVASALLAGAVGLAYSQLLNSASHLLIAAGFMEVLLLQVCASTIFGAYLPELFPTDIRGTGVGFSIACGRLAAAASPYLVLTILDHANVESVFVILSLLLFLLAALVGFAGPETKGRTLEIIDDERRGRALPSDEDKPYRPTGCTTADKTGSGIQ